MKYETRAEILGIKFPCEIDCDDDTLMPNSIEIEMSHELKLTLRKEIKEAIEIIEDEKRAEKALDNKNYFGSQFNSGI
jgi:hypothetical protein